MPRDSNAVDGDYIAYYNSTGHEVHERVTSPEDLLAERDFADPAGLERRWHNIRPGYFCGCANRMKTADYEGAISALKAQFDDRTRSIIVRQGMSAYSIRKSVVAFLCNPRRGAGDAPSSTGHMVEFDIIMNHIQEQCGYLVPGTWSGSFPTTLAWGYMNWVKGLDFCENSDEGTPGRC